MNIEIKKIVDGFIDVLEEGFKENPEGTGEYEYSLLNLDVVSDAISQVAKDEMYKDSRICAVGNTFDLIAEKIENVIDEIKDTTEIEDLENAINEVKELENNLKNIRHSVQDIKNEIEDEIQEYEEKVLDSIYDYFRKQGCDIYCGEVFPFNGGFVSLQAKQVALVRKVNNPS